jgi:hypothetical protein
VKTNAQRAILESVAEGSGAELSILATIVGTAALRLRKRLIMELMPHQRFDRNDRTPQN